MALKDLSLEAMVSVSERLLNPPANRPQPQNKDEMYSGVLVLQRAHDNLVALNKREGEVSRLTAQYTEQLADLDREHDRCSRVLYRALEASADIAEDPVVADKCREAMGVLHPNGLSVNQLSYTEQAGNTMRVAQRVTPDLRPLLAMTTLVGIPLDTVLDRWLAAGKKLGELQAERDTLNTDHDPNRVTPAILLDARNRWIGAANAFISALNTTDYTEEEKTAILAHLRAVEAQAMKRRASGSAEAADTSDTSDASDTADVSDVAEAQGATVVPLADFQEDEVVEP